MAREGGGKAAGAMDIDGRGTFDRRAENCFATARCLWQHVRVMVRVLVGKVVDLDQGMVYVARRWAGPLRLERASSLGLDLP